MIKCIKNIPNRILPTVEAGIKKHVDRHKKYNKEYNQTEKGKAVHKQADKKYYSTINGYLKYVYNNIKQRCNNPGCSNYKDYGGRGIQNKFESLDDFRNYVINILNIDPRKLVIDRINNGGHYEKGNIQFVTYSENNRNQRKRYETS